MYEYLNRDFLDIINKASSITLMDCELEDNLMPIDNYKYLIDDLILHIEKLEEKIKEIEKDVEDNYTRIPISSQVGISDSDFI